MNEPGTILDQDFIETLVDKILDGIALASTDPTTGAMTMRPVENLCALHNIMMVTLASFPPAADDRVDHYIDSFATAMRVAIDEQRRLRDMPIPANSN